MNLQDVKSVNDFDHKIDMHFQVSPNEELTRIMNPERHYYKRDHSNKREIGVKAENQDKRVILFWQTALAKKLSGDRIELHEALELNANPTFQHEIPQFNENIVNAIRQYRAFAAADTSIDNEEMAGY